MNIKSIPIKEIKTNPNNPRIIKDEKFKKLVKSIQDFPAMLEIRPIVIDENNVVLGGNQRLKACKEAGLKNVPVIYVDNLTEKEKQEFIIKDNSNMGDWDWNILTDKWSFEDLEEWGIDTLNFGNTDVIEQVNYETEWVGMPEFESKEEGYKLIVNFETTEDRETFVRERNIEISRKLDKTWITTYPYKERFDQKLLRYD